MKLQLRNSLFLAAVITMLFTSCSKDGDQGPQGEQGVAGPAGPAGPAGASGSIIYSGWLDVKFTADVVDQNGTPTTIGYYADIAAPKLTKEILANGEIKAYLNLNTATAPDVLPLPHFQPSGVSVNVDYEVGVIHLYANIDASTTGNPKLLQYRYVLAPGTVAARSDRSINWDNYSEVKTFLNLQD